MRSTLTMRWLIDALTSAPVAASCAVIALFWEPSCLACSACSAAWRRNESRSAVASSTARCSCEFCEAIVTGQRDPLIHRADHTEQTTPSRPHRCRPHRAAYLRLKLADGLGGLVPAAA